MNLTAETHIVAPPEQVWAWLMAPETWVLLVPMTRHVELVTPPPLRVGSRARFTMSRSGGEMVTEAEITAAEPPRTLALRNHVPELGIEVDTLLTLTPEGADTRVRQSLSLHFTSFLGRALGEGMVRARNPEAHMREGLARLKQLVESAA